MTHIRGPPFQASGRDAALRVGTMLSTVKTSTLTAALATESVGRPPAATIRPAIGAPAPAARPIAPSPIPSAFWRTAGGTDATSMVLPPTTPAFQPIPSRTSTAVNAGPAWAPAIAAHDRGP